jgi:hypothetical protein
MLEGEDAVAEGDAGAGEELVVLATVFDPMEGQIIASKLRSASIDCVVKHDTLSVVYGLTVDGAGRQEILVRAGDLEEAEAALTTDEGEADVAFSADDPGGDEPED